MTVTVASADTTGPRARSTAPAHRWFRGDVDGLRAVAIVLVVAYHAGVPWFGGGFIGVDVFFVISGFLISRNLLRESDGHQRVSLASFWARRIRRLVPALALVIVGTLAVGTFVFPLYQMGDFARQGAAAAFYVSNIKFAGQAQSYFNGDLSSSPFLHTWSLGVEEQFYLLWPLLFALVCWTARKPLSRRIPGFSRKALIAVFAVTFVVSLGIDLVLTHHGSTWAFYGLQSRAWEFAAAGLLAAVEVPAVLRGVGTRTALAVSGAVLLLVGLVTIRSDTPYPGLWALLPVGATMALITAGHTWGGDVRANAVSGVLSTRPAQWLGRVSYSWYLWHWPAIVMVSAAFASTNVGLAVAAAIWALGMAWLAYHYYETPIRFLPALADSNARTYAFGATLTVVVLFFTFAVRPATPRVPDASAQAKASSVSQLEAPPGSSLQEQVAFAVNLYRQRVQTTCPKQAAIQDADGDKYCVGGDPSATGAILLLGDSHAGQWLPEVDEVARAEHLKLLVRLHDGCPPIPVHVASGTGDASTAVTCLRATAGDLRMIATLKPQIVMVATWNGYLGRILDAGNRKVPLTQQVEIWAQGMTTVFQAAHRAGAKLGYVYDEPTLPIDASKCIALHNAVAPCVQSRSVAMARTQPLIDVEHQVVAETGHVATLDMSALVCNSATCPLLQGRTLVYVDTHHLTDAFAYLHLSDIRRLVDQARAE